MSLNYPPNTQFEARAIGFATGLAGTITVSIRDNVGGVALPATSIGIVEDPAGSGSYITTLSSPLDPGQYSIMWDDTSGGPSSVAFEDLVVTGTFTPSPVLPGEILASIDDINASIDGDIVQATSENTNLIQISVARIIRGYLARSVDTATLVGWQSPDTTPDIIREAAAKLIASQLYLNESSRTSIIIEDAHYAQRLYDEGMAILNGILNGSILIDGVDTDTSESMADLDFWPIDSTDRAFTAGMEL